jgi:5-methylcytosine-specific restriction protein A
MDENTKFLGKAWDALIEAVEQKKCLTYSELVKKIDYQQGFSGNISIGKKVLGPIQEFCKKKSLPPLTVVIVRKDSGNPGIGFDSKTGKIDNDKKSVEEFNWRSILNPFIEKWTEEEIETSVNAYLLMLNKESKGESYSKTSIISDLLKGPLEFRSKASIEYRMQNISAILKDLNLPIIKGYLPAKNVGSGIKNRILTILEKNGTYDPKDYESTYDKDELQKKVTKLIKRGLIGTPKGTPNPPHQLISNVSVYARDPRVKAWVLINAKGLCESCGEKAPFIRDDGSPFLEVHHVRQLSDGGSDQISNAVALCPNCHRQCHFSKDRTNFIDSLYQAITRLNRE